MDIVYPECPWCGEQLCFYKYGLSDECAYCSRKVKVTIEKYHECCECDHNTGEDE